MKTRNETTVCVAAFAMLAVFLLASAAAAADDEPADPGPVKLKYRVTGLFSPDRQDDLRTVVDRLPDVDLVRIDYERAEATFDCDPAKLFEDDDPEQFPKRLDKLLRSVSCATFGIRPLYQGAREELERIEIGVVGLDCKGCSFAAYEAVCAVDGVEQATASFKEGLVTAWIDPEKTDRGALESALTKKGVPLNDE